MWYTYVYHIVDYLGNCEALYEITDLVHKMLNVHLTLTVERDFHLPFTRGPLPNETLVPIEGSFFFRYYALGTLMPASYDLLPHAEFHTLALGP